MELNKINLLSYDEIIEYYKSKNTEEIQKIIPKWAVFENEEKTLYSELKSSSKEYEIILVKLNLLISKSDFFEVEINKLFTEKKLNDCRVAKILRNWENNIFLDPPIIGICNYDNYKLSISDGRHRTKTAFFIGEKTIPIAIHISEILQVKKILNLNKKT